MAFFNSRARLVTGDTDESYDVYQWRNGELSLVTVGTAQHALYKGNDRSGRNVYFVTRDALTWQDFDAVADVYTARVGGGIDEPVASPVCSLAADGCQGAGVGPRAVPAAQTTRGGDANVLPGVRARVSLARVGVLARRRAARTGVLGLRVRTSGPGRVSAVARARLAGKTRRVAKAAARSRGAGRVVLRLRLDRRARHRLRAGRPLRLAVDVAMAGARGQTATVLLRRAGR
jgi:hypothetical protein